MTLRVCMLSTVVVFFNASQSTAEQCTLARKGAGRSRRTSSVVVVESPNKKLRVEIGLRDQSKVKQAAQYRVLIGGKSLVDWSRLGIDLKRTGEFGGKLNIGEVARTAVDKTWSLVVGKTRRARDHFRQVVIPLTDAGKPNRRIDLVFRAYNDGVAFRYRFPKQSTLKTFAITDEHSQFRFPPESTAYVLPLKTYSTSYEALYKIMPLRDVSPKQLIGLPLLLKHSSGAWVAITEANLTDYSGMYLSTVAGRPGVLTSRLSPQPKSPDVKVKAKTPHVSPWRVLMIGDRPGALMESNLIVNLNEPCGIRDTSWIRAGKIHFPWWNGYVVRKAKIKGGLNTATLKSHIDFCAKYGIEYASLDGFQNQSWYGGPIRPDMLVDVTTAIPEIDLPAVLRYAKTKGIRMRAWMHWKALQPQIDKAFAAYEKMGLEGVMIDFMDRDDQEMVAFYHEIARKAAKHRLTVNFHGAYKATGIRRTWPNVLTREGVLNLEYDKFRNRRCPPEHNLIVPFTRMLAGPLDYHQGGFRSVTAASFKSRYIAPNVIGTRCHHMAMYVVYENYLPMVADFPAAYDKQIGAKLLQEIPASWDAMKVLDGDVGKFVVIVRRRGKVWWIGGMSAGKPRESTIQLSFLGKGKFTADIYQDDDDSPSKAVFQKRSVTAKDTLKLKLGMDGGYVIRIAPAVCR